MYPFSDLSVVIVWCFTNLTPNFISNEKIYRVRKIKFISKKKMF